MKKIFLLTLLFFSVGCFSADKSGPDSLERNPSKLSVKQEGDEGLRLGLLFQVAQQHSHLEREFQAQLPKFQQCQHLGKSQDFRADVTWVLARDGQFERIEFVKLFPDNQELKTCLLRQFNRIRMGKQVAPIEGELVLGSFSSQVPGWLKPPQPQMRE